MKFYLTSLFSFLFFICYAQTIQENYPVDSASVEMPGVPKGEILKFEFENSKIFPGTWRECSVYIPAQYSGDQPACLYVNQDGIQWKAPTVFDNLIHAKEMPITIGVFITPGKVKAADTATSLDRMNRSYEYDGLGDNYIRFLIEELLPEVEKLKTRDGRTIRISKNGNDRAIGGSSSGAVCAFTAAWERPDVFAKVFSAIGTYVSLRGADRYPSLIRKQEPKRIKIFLQDGSNDLNIYAGDWWKANETMERALAFAGYDIAHVWGEGGHNGRHGTAIFPQAMRWLWKDYPREANQSKSKNPFLDAILKEGEGWQLVGEKYGFTEGTAVNAAGEVYYQDIPNSKTYKMGLDNKLITLDLNSKRASGTAFDKEGNRYTAAGGSKQILKYDLTGKETVVTDSISSNDITVSRSGNIYITSPDGRERPSKIYLIRPNGEKSIVDEGLKFANGLCLSPDQTQLYITESASHWVWVYQIKPDGTLTAKQKYGYLHVRDIDENAWADGLKCDRDGRIYVTTYGGIQVMDQLGRVNAIIPVPSGNVSNLCFGGKDFDTIYVSSNDKVYSRKVKTIGANSFDLPHKPGSPRL